MSGLFQWESVPDPDEGGHGSEDDAVRRRRVRILVAACVGGALAILAITVAAALVVAREVDRRSGTDPNTLHRRYAEQFRACVARPDSAPADCATAIERRCERDPGWGSSRDVSERSGYCTFPGSPADDHQGGVAPTATTSPS